MPPTAGTQDTQQPGPETPPAASNRDPQQPAPTTQPQAPPRATQKAAGSHPLSKGRSCSLFLPGGTRHPQRGKCQCDCAAEASLPSSLEGPVTSGPQQEGKQAEIHVARAT
ncbi:unnamed protein product, partial [Gulo gulo]